MQSLAGQDIALIHPWDLSGSELPPSTLRIGIYLKEHHAQWPWTEARWRWVQQAMACTTTEQWWIDARTLGQAISQARSAHALHDPHIARHDLPIDWHPPVRLFPPVQRQCNSFSAWWKLATQRKAHARDLLSEW